MSVNAGRGRRKGIWCGVVEGGVCGAHVSDGNGCDEVWSSGRGRGAPVSVVWNSRRGCDEVWSRGRGRGAPVSVVWNSGRGCDEVWSRGRGRGAPVSVVWNSGRGVESWKGPWCGVVEEAVVWSSGRGCDD